MNRQGVKQSKVDEYDLALLKESRGKYIELYNNNSKRSGVNKFWLLSLQIRTMLLIMFIDKAIEENKSISYIYRLTGYYDNAYFRNYIKKILVPDLPLENILAICDYVGISLYELKKRVLKDLMQVNGEQNEKIYERINKQYSPN